MRTSLSLALLRELRLEELDAAARLVVVEEAGAPGERRQQERSCDEAAAATPLLLTRVLDVGAAVLRPRLLVVAHRHRLFLAEAHGLDTAILDAEHGHHLLHGLRATLAEREVVLAAAALVAIALDADRESFLSAVM
jgi:hypothetical protein